ncbi:hypothetical protein [Albidovulum sp.]
MSVNTTYFVDVHGDGEFVDLMPLAREVLETCPYKNDLTALELAQLTEKHANGKYISVDVQDRVSGRKLGMLIGRVMCWARGPRRIKQLRDPELRQLMPYVALEVERGCCARARKMSRRFLSPDELEVLPFRDCWRPACWCTYRAYTPELAARECPGRLKRS